MVLVTIGQLVAASEVLARLSAHRLPAGQQHVAYRLSKLRRAVADELRYFEKERRALIEQYGQSRAATRQEVAAGAEPIVWEVDPGSPSWALFLARMKELLSVRAEVDASPLSPDDLQSFEMSALDFEALDSFIQDDVMQETVS